MRDNILLALKFNESQFRTIEKIKPGIADIALRARRTRNARRAAIPGIPFSPESLEVARDSITIPRYLLLTRNNLEEKWT